MFRGPPFAAPAGSSRAPLPPWRHMQASRERRIEGEKAGSRGAERQVEDLDVGAGAGALGGQRELGKTGGQKAAPR